MAFSTPFLADRILKLGYLGVDFFFVLSGFIIFHSTIGRNRTIGSYAAARFKRVYLPYLPVGLSLALLYSLAPHLSASSRDWAWFPTLTLAPVASATALSVAWTLKHEVLFYVLFGLGFFLGRLWQVLGLWLVFIMIAMTFRAPENIVLAPINLEFFFGIACAMLARRNWGPDWLVPVGLALIAIWLLTGADRSFSPVVGLAFALIILPIVRRERMGALRVPRWLTFLGAASYAIYLVHNPLISVAARFYSSDPYGMLLCGSSAGLLGGILYYWFVERRIMKSAFLTGSQAPG
jgi:peptidoglycan/LPS O-acetylase OafA/YrhL